MKVYFCSDDSRRWFVEQEVSLFNSRFGIESSSVLNAWLKLNRLKVEPIGAEERAELLPYIRDSSPYTYQDNEEVYKVRFCCVWIVLNEKRC